VRGKLNVIREKVEEGEVKSHGCWPSLTPYLSLFLQLLSFPKGIFFGPRRRGITLYQNCQKENIEHHSNMVFSFGFLV
jgi:hypothetical protein